MREITVLVPEEQVVGFYAMYADWLLAQEEIGGKKPRVRAWASRDTAIMEKLVDRVSDTALRFFRILAKHPGKAFSAVDIAQELGLKSSYQLAGSVSWPGKYAGELGRPPLQSVTTDSDGGTAYVMSKTIASLFKKVDR